MREHTIIGWAELESELDAWRATGMSATFWWRDDDATRPGARLDRLIDIADGAPVSLAVIPAEATEALAAWTCRQNNVTVVQHGYAHTNYAPAGAKKSEFGDNRPVVDMLADIDAGHVRLSTLFGNRYRPIFVPPWNRFSAGLMALLKERGFQGISAYGQHQKNAPLTMVNCHADPIEWRGSRGFVGEAEILEQIVGHLSARRMGHVDAVEATGLLTHHRDHDPAGWRFLAALVQAVAAHPSSCWMSADAAFSGGRQ